MFVHQIWIFSSKLQMILPAHSTVVASQRRVLSHPQTLPSHIAFTSCRVAHAERIDKAFFILKIDVLMMADRRAIPMVQRRRPLDHLTFRFKYFKHTRHVYIYQNAWEWKLRLQHEEIGGWHNWVLVFSFLRKEAMKSMFCPFLTQFHTNVHTTQAHVSTVASIY